MSTVSVVWYMYRICHNGFKKKNVYLTQTTGRVAALGMMGRATDFKTVPYFWSAMFGKTIRYAGNVASDSPAMFE